MRKRNLIVGVIVASLLFGSCAKSSDKTQANGKGVGKSTENNLNICNWVLVTGEQAEAFREKSQKPKYQLNDVYQGTKFADLRQKAHKKDLEFYWFLNSKFSAKAEYLLGFTNYHYIADNAAQDLDINQSLSKLSVCIKNLTTGEEKIIIKEIAQAGEYAKVWWLDDERFIYQKAEDMDRGKKNVMYLADITGDSQPISMNEYDNILYANSGIVLAEKNEDDKIYLCKLNVGKSLQDISTVKDVAKDSVIFMTSDAKRVVLRENAKQLNAETASNEKLVVVDIATGEVNYISKPAELVAKKIEFDIILAGDELIYIEKTGENDNQVYKYKLS